jgi:ribose-phosphate pyrophosphokinase
VRTLFEAGIRTVRSSDNVPHPTNAIMLNGILAGALANEVVGARP